jgi:hypothetical protein
VFIRAIKRREEENIATIALHSIQTTIGEPLTPPKKNPHAVALSRLGASKGEGESRKTFSQEESRDCHESRTGVMSKEARIC